MISNLALSDPNTLHSEKPLHIWCCMSIEMEKKMSAIMKFLCLTYIEPYKSPLEELSIILILEDKETEPHISLVANRDHTNSRWQACGGLEPRISPYSTLSCGTVKFSQFFKTVVLCLGRHQQHPEGWLKHRWLGLTPQSSQLTRTRLGLRICTSEKLPGDADAACLGATLWEPLPEEINSSESQSKKYIQWP